MAWHATSAVEGRGGLTTYEGEGEPWTGVQEAPAQEDGQLVV